MNFHDSSYKLAIISLMSGFLKTFYAALFAVSFAAQACASADEAAAKPGFEIVESVPLETSLGSSLTSRTAETWLDLINRARESLDIEVFYISSEPGQPMENVLSAIRSAAGRGVKARIIIDASFYKNNREAADALKGIENIHLRKIPFFKIAGGIMHAKFFIADRAEVFMGSQNFDWRALIHVHEIGARISDRRIAKAFLDVFEKDWQLSGGESPPGSGAAELPPVNAEDPAAFKTASGDNELVYPAFSPAPFVPENLACEEDELLKLINDAQRRISIQVMTYSTKQKGNRAGWKIIDNALRAAAARGVAVQIILADWAAKPGAIKTIRSLASVPGIEIKISELPPYSKGFIPYARVEHCKYMIVDGAASWIGTGNWEYGYFHESRDAALIIKGEHTAAVLRQIFDADWNGPYVSAVGPHTRFKKARKGN